MPSGDANLTYRIDSYGAPSPGTATQTFTFLFTAFGNATSGSSAKALFLADGRGNQIQVGIPSASSGKVAMTKLSGGVYISPPWTWQ
jgi:hypothetical protein